MTLHGRLLIIEQNAIAPGPIAQDCEILSPFDEAIMRFWLAVAALNGACAVVLGAIGAHGLGGNTTDAARAIYATAVRYHFIHSLALLGTALFYPYFAVAGRGWLTIAGLAFLAGILLFCGGLYVFSAMSIAVGARLAPVGGTLFIIGWLALFAAAFTAPKRR